MIRSAPHWSRLRCARCSLRRRTSPRSRSNNWARASASPKARPGRKDGLPDLQRHAGRPPAEVGSRPGGRGLPRGGQRPQRQRLRSEGRLYTCETRTRRVTRTDKKGAIEVLAEKWEGKRFNAPNDIVVSKNGHVYFTDPAFGEQADHRELDFYGVYHIPPEGPDEAGGQAGGPAQRHRAFAQRPTSVRGQFGRAQRARLRPGQERRRRPTSVCSSPESPACPAASAWTRRAICTSPANGIAIYSPEGKLLHMIERSRHPVQLRVRRGRLQDAVHHGGRRRSTGARLDVKGAY